VRTRFVNGNTFDNGQADLDIGRGDSLVSKELDGLEQMATVRLRKEVH
jgi:hypothetical protein